MGLGCDKEDGLATAMGLPTDPESDFLYMPLHRFSLVPELAEQHIEDEIRRLTAPETEEKDEAT